jgi:hypothetical protein
MAMNLNDHEWAGEIDMVAGNCRIPGERMKSGRPHVVRLCERAVALLATMPREGEQSTDPVAYTDPPTLGRPGPKTAQPLRRSTVGAGECPSTFLRTKYRDCVHQL